MLIGRAISRIWSCYKSRGASFEGLNTGVIPFEGSDTGVLQIVAYLHAMCTDKNHSPKALNYNDNAFNGLDAALRGVSDKETTGVTIQVKVWYPPMYSATDPDNYAY